MTPETLKQLMACGESRDMDWKRDFPPELRGGRGDPEWDRGRARVLKAIVAIANAEGHEAGHLIYGVEDRTAAERHLHGIQLALDDADIQQWAENTFDPPPSFQYEELLFPDSIRVGAFTIERSSCGPHVVRSDLGGMLYRGQVWFRRGSKNTVALREDLARLMKPIEPLKFRDIQDRFLKELDAFYRSQGRKTSLRYLTERDALLAQGYELARDRKSGREIWAGPIGHGQNASYQYVMFVAPQARDHR